MRRRRLAMVDLPVELWDAALAGEIADGDWRAMMAYHDEYMVRLSTFELWSISRGPVGGLWASRGAVVTGFKVSCSLGNSGSVCTGH